MLSTLKVFTALACTFVIGIIIGVEIDRNHQLIIQNNAKNEALFMELTKRYSTEDAGTVFTMITPPRTASFLIDHRVQSIASDHKNQLASFSIPIIYTH
jgi:hypothetical protein